MINIQLIEQKVLNYLNDVALCDRFGYNLAMSENTYKELLDEEKQYLQEMIQTECHGQLIHNEYITSNDILLVDNKKSISNQNKIINLSEV